MTQNLGASRNEKSQDPILSSPVRPWLGLRHPVSGALHFLGVGVGGVSLLLGVHRALEQGRTHSALAFGGFCAAMVLLYGSSTSYHWFSLSEASMQRLRKLDHSMIFIFIAASFTPFLWLALNSDQGKIWLWIIWLATLLGVGAKFFKLGKSRWLTVFPYVALGSAGFVILPQLGGVLTNSQLRGLIIGGVIYLVGALVYALKRPDPFPAYFGFHEIWHIFVLAGSFFHLWVLADFLIF